MKKLWMISTTALEELLAKVVVPGATEEMPSARGIRRYITSIIIKRPAKQMYNDYGLDFDSVVERNLLHSIL